VKDSMFFSGKLKYSRLTDGPPKPKGRIWNPKNFSPGVLKWGMEYAVFNLHGWMYKGYRI
jgi:hypothetical protein